MMLQLVVWIEITSNLDIGKFCRHLQQSATRHCFVAVNMRIMHYAPLKGSCVMSI